MSIESSEFLSPLSRARRRLEGRLLTIERKMQGDSDDADLWRDYIVTVDLLLQVMDRTGGALLTTKEMAARLGVHPDTVRTKVKEGALRPAAKLGRRGGYRFRADIVP
ncbi:MAG: helix-turn-helix domain-containing protein [Candidatus Rokubacteria bacterium]|nr:helix-turn-helix domain-containing protein [Candidatus Rokubacteria bacterium]